MCHALKIWCTGFYSYLLCVCEISGAVWIHMQDSAPANKVVKFYSLKNMFAQEKDREV